MPCSIPPPILKYQHFASNGPYAPRACKPKSIATYYKTALQILHTSQNLLLGMLPSCQLAEQRLGLSKEMCKRPADCTHKWGYGLGLDSGHWSCKPSVGKESKINWNWQQARFQVGMPPSCTGKAAKSPWLAPAGFAMQGKEEHGPAELAPSSPCPGRSMVLHHGHHGGSRGVAAAALVLSCWMGSVLQCSGVIN